MIWTWNGREIQFITDVLGVAPLGASDGEGTYFPVDHDEYVHIPAAALRPVNGRYDIRVTEELSEVSYLDRSNYKRWTIPRARDLHQRKVQSAAVSRGSPVSASSAASTPQPPRDDQGRDVRARCSPPKIRRYPDQFARTELGVARPAHARAGLRRAAPSGRAVLLLNGWVDWPDGSTFRAAAQESKTGLVDAISSDAGRRRPVEHSQPGHGHARWQAQDDRRRPASLALRVAQAAHRHQPVRLLGRDLPQRNDDEPRAIRRPVPLLSADLHFRGFSASPHPPAAQAARHVHLLPKSRRHPSGTPLPASTRATARFAACSAKSTTAWPSWAPATR